MFVIVNRTRSQPKYFYFGEEDVLYPVLMIGKGRSDNQYIYPAYGFMTGDFYDEINSRYQWAELVHWFCFFEKSWEMHLAIENLVSRCQFALMGGTSFWLEKISAVSPNKREGEFVSNTGYLTPSAIAQRQFEFTNHRIHFKSGRDFHTQRCEALIAEYDRTYRLVKEWFEENCQKHNTSFEALDRKRKRLPAFDGAY
jgi:hypothetical protein